MSADIHFWKPIEGFNDYYVTEDGIVGSEKSGELKILSSTIGSTGYYRITLVGKDGSQTKKVHKLVAETWLSNPSKLSMVNHIDGLKTNNNVKNLEFVTAKENSHHSTVVLGNKRLGRSVYQLSKDGKILNKFSSITEASLKTKGSISGISAACAKRRPNHKSFRWIYAEELDSCSTKNKIKLQKEVGKWKLFHPYTNYKVSEDGRIYSFKMSGLLKPFEDKGGYQTVTLVKDGKKKFYVHRLVAKIYVPNPLNLPLVNHKNGNPRDNSAANLEWVTYSQNIQHAYNTKRRLSKSVLQLDLNGKVIKLYASMALAAKELQITRQCISNVCSGKQKTAGGFTWKFV